MEKAIFLSDLNSDFLAKAKEFQPSTIFLREASITDVAIALLQENLPNCKINAIMDIFSETDLTPEMLEEKPVEAQGKEAAFAWYKGVCPNNPRTRNYRLDRVEALAANAHISGIWFDSFHYPTFWQASEPEIFDTCYCATCMKLFSETKLDGDRLPEELEALVDAIDGQYYTEWLEFKSTTISSFAQEARLKLAGRTKLGFFAVPWTDQDFGTGNKRLLGQNLDELAQIFDYVSPMFFPITLGKDPSIIATWLDYFSQFCTNLYPALLNSQELLNQDVTAALTVADVLKEPSIKGFLVMDFAALINSPSTFEQLRDSYNL